MAHRTASVDRDTDPVALALKRDPQSRERAADVASLRKTRDADSLGVEPDARDLEEVTARDLAHVDAPHALPGDDGRGFGRIDRYRDRVRDIHDAAEGQDPERDVRVQQG